MMDVLVASRPPRFLKPREFLGSCVGHSCMLAMCVALTHTTVKVATHPVVDTSMVFLPRLAPAIADRPVERLGRRGGGGGEGDANTQLVISANPPPRGFQVVDAVTSVPTVILPPDPGEQLLDARDFTGRGVEGGAGWGVVGGTGSIDQPHIEGEVRELLYQSEVKDARFEPAEFVEVPTFVHPRIMLEAGISGRVLLQFIVDTLGRVEPKSVTVLETTNAAFAESARVGMLEARFRPARFGSQCVRQLSKLPVTFQIATR